MSAIIVLILRFLLAAALYAFLAWALITLWRELRAQARLASERRVPPLSVFVSCAGGDFRQQIAAPDIFAGRDPSCDLVIPDETVSSRHARFSYHDRQWWVEDLRSTNGTLLNKEPVTTPTVIISGDEVACGGSLIRINILP